MSITQRIKSWIEYRKVKKLTDKGTINALENGEISESMITKAVGTIDGIEAQKDALIEVIEQKNKPNIINGVANKVSGKALVNAYQESKIAKEGLINSGGTDILTDILLNPQTEQYKELYDIAIRVNEKSDFDLVDLLKNIIEEEKQEYNPEEILKVIAGRLERNIENYGGPLHYKIFIEIMKTNEEKMQLPDYLKRLCEVEIEKNENVKNRPNSIIKNLERFDPNKLKSEIKEFIKYKENLKGNDTLKQGNVR